MSGKKDKIPSDGGGRSPETTKLDEVDERISQTTESQKAPLEEDCLTVTEVTELSTIDEITAEDEEFDEDSCRTTATMVSSNGAAPSLGDSSSTPPESTVNGGSPKRRRLETLLRRVSTHCQVTSCTATATLLYTHI